MVTALACRFGKEQGTVKALGAVDVGVLEEEDRVHARAFGAVWGAIGVARRWFVGRDVQLMYGLPGVSLWWWERDPSLALWMTHLGVL
jgi:hypothetical protein